MNQRERLISWIMDSVGGCARHWAEIIADGILERGGIAPPCKVGDTVYALFYRPISKKYFITPIVVEGMVFEKDDWYITTSNDGCFFGDLLNVDWFITQEAAEIALRKCET